MAGHPLRPATRRRLGEPLPRQLADRPRTNQEATGYPVFSLATTWSINPSFPGLFSSSRHVTHVLRTRSPLNIPVLLQKYPVRLACLIHAASVRSEPESNSPKIGASFLLQKDTDFIT